MKWLHNADTDQWEAATERWRMCAQQSPYSADW
jgi:hypothetical protein